MEPLEAYNILDLIKRRGDQPSFHIASEDHVRIEFRTMKCGEHLGPIRYSGNVVVTGFNGLFLLLSDGPPLTLGQFDQCVTQPNASFDVECQQDGTIQLIWAPPFAVSQSG